MLAGISTAPPSSPKKQQPDKSSMHEPWSPLTLVCCFALITGKFLNVVRIISLQSLEGPDMLHVPDANKGIQPPKVG